MEPNWIRIDAATQLFFLPTSKPSLRYCTILKYWRPSREENGLKWQYNIKNVTYDSNSALKQLKKTKHSAWGESKVPLLDIRDCLAVGL